MGFKRNWGESCPRVWDQWESDGIKWIIQDLPPEDEDAAIELLLKHFCPDETMCSSSNLSDEVESERGLAEFWRECMSQRMSLSCYAETNGTRKLAGLNVCLVKCKEDQKDENDEKINGKAWQNVYETIMYMESRLNTFEVLGLDKVLHAVGLVVSKDYRGARLGSRILSAREPLCRSQGVGGTATIFTGVSSQKSATRSGFTTALEVTLRELAEAGLNYPKDNDRFIKYMVKKYE